MIKEEDAIIKFKLSKPLTVESNVMIEEIFLREPTAGDFTKFKSEDNDMAKMLKIISILSKVGLNFIEKMKVKDVNGLMEEIEPFL